MLPIVQRGITSLKDKDLAKEYESSFSRLRVDPHLKESKTKTEIVAYPQSVPI